MNQPRFHTHIGNRLGSKCEFVFADITQRLPFENETFDLIYSASVLEHIMDLPAAFREMRRVLKPGGFLLHRYNPYFSANGGHAWGCLDSPWAHVKLSLDDHLRYLKELRLLEADEAGKWVSGTLNRTNISGMQNYLAESELRIELWEEVPETPEILQSLSNSTIVNCQACYPGTTLADLTTRDVLFVASLDSG